MTVSVNPVNNRDSDADILRTALGVAQNIYGVVMDNKRQAKLDEITGKKAEAEQAAKTAVQTEARRKEETDIAKNFLKLPENSTDPEAAKLTLPDGSVGLFLPRQVAKERADRKIEGQKIAQTSADKKIAQNKQQSEVLYRYNALAGNADKLKELVKNEGTVALFGSKGTDMDSKIYQMAVDYAKLIDPDSVAREGEVAAAQKYMLPIRNWGGFGMKNETAMSAINDYLNSLDDRLKARIDSMEANGQDASNLKEVLAAAQKNRGGSQEKPSTGTAIAAPTSDVQLINGVPYKKVNGGWQRVSDGR